MLSKFARKIISFFQLVIVLIFILFEEVIWEGISKPIYEYIHSLKILQKTEAWLRGVNAYVIVVIFVLLLGFVELLGIYAGLLFVQGKMWHGMSLYLTKIPIAAFTFWVFRVTENKLMQFGWFKWTYDKIMSAIAWIKSTDIYISTIEKIRTLKTKMKAVFKDLKEKFFAEESRFVNKIKRFYRVIKASLDKK
jgi:uncharacterized membrane protein